MNPIPSDFLPSALACVLLLAAPAPGAESTASDTAISPSLAREAVAAFYKEHAQVPRDGSGPWVEMIAKAGGPEELRKLMKQINDDGFTATATVDALDALSAAAARSERPTSLGNPDQPLLDPDYRTLTRLLYSDDVNIQAAAARLAGAWKMENVADRLAQLATSDVETVRRDSFEALRAIGGKTALSFFAVLVRPDQDAALRRRALVAIAEISLDGAVMKAVEVLPLIDNEADALETWRGLLKVDRAANSFAVRLPGGLPAPVIAAGLRAARELGAAGEPLAKALTRQAEDAADPTGRRAK